MPLLIHVVVAWIGGLLSAALFGAALFGVAMSAERVLIGGVAASLVASVLLRERRRATQHVALIAVACAGVWYGAAASRRDASCRAGLARDTVLRVAIDDRVAPGGYTAGIARAADEREPTYICRVRVALRVADGAGSPGAVMLATGRFRATDRGLRGDASLEPTGEVDRMRAWRGSTGETIDSLFGTDAPLVRALLIADQDGIPPAVRDRFADAGLVHMLSISGLHVAIIASALLVLASAARMPRDVATIAALAVVALYVLMLGAPPPAVRSAVMLATVTISERLQRPVHAWTALALGAVIPTVDATVVLDLGYQLSVSGMAALVAARAILRRVRQHLHQRRAAFARGWRWQLLREIATGIIATLVTLPLIAWTFGRVSLIAPLSNIVAGPVVTFVQPALFLALVLQSFPMLARFVAGACALPLALLDRVASVSASVPFASLHVSPSLAGAVCAGVASAAFVRATASRRFMPGLLVSGAAMVIWLLLPLARRGTGRMAVHMIDVGQGDAIAIETPGRRWIVVDAGRAWDGGDAGQRVVVPYIRRLGGEVALFVMSHAHDDHVGGAASLVAALRPRQWWEPAYVTTSRAYEMALVALERRHLAWRRVHPGQALELDGVHVTVLAPDSAWTAAQHDANETSVVLRVSFGTVAFLLTGDAEASEEQWLLAHTDPALLRADVLKLGHHGSRTSSTSEFVNAVDPALGLVSVGAENRYGHPSLQVLQEFSGRNIPLLRTDREGSIVVETDGTTLWATARGQRWIPARR